MTYPEYSITNYLWAAEIIAKVILLYFIIARKMLRSHPAFAFYTAISMIWELMLVWIVIHGYFGPLHFRTYWYGQLVTCLVLIGVIYEVLKSAFNTAFSVFRTHLTKLFTLAGTMVLVISFFSFQISAEPTLDEFVRRLDRAASLLLLATFGFTTLISNYFGLVWKPKTYGIALGFLFYYGVSAFVSVLMAGFHSSIPALNAINVLTFLISELVWVRYCAVTKKPQSVSLQDVERLREALIYSS